MSELKTLSESGEYLTEETHESVYNEIDPSNIRLERPFVACVIGASRGIGAGIAKAFATASASTIILAARSTDQLQSVAEEIKQLNSKVEVPTMKCDVTSESSLSELASKIEADFERLDAIIYNSGYAGKFVMKVTEGKPSEFERGFAVNSIGTYYAAHFLIPLLLKSSNGAKLFIAVSTAGSWMKNGLFASPGYCISKLAQMRLLEMISIQYRNEGLFAAGVHPGAVKTEMAKDAPEEFLPYLVDDVALCGAFCTWLAANRKELEWLNGRYLSAKWDVKQLASMKDAIVS
ncbi:MAG: hypothetical protein LQ340_004216, partial [Diploschistes diacapsis]